MQYISKGIGLLTALLVYVAGIGQQTTPNAPRPDTEATNVDSVQKKKNVFTANLNYQSRLHFFGRTDPQQSQGVFPTVGYETKIGLYANGSAIFINNAQQHMDYTGSIIEAGYKLPSSKNFSGNLFYNHFLYNEESQLVQAALKGQAGANFTYNNKIVNVTVGSTLMFSNRTDFTTSAGLDHLFIYLIPNTKSAIAVNPSAYVHAGSQNFTQTYYRQRGIAGIGLGQQLVTEEVEQFNVLSYEFSLPVVFVLGKFNASVTGSYVMPQNLITVPNRPEQSEFGKNMFYVSASVGVRL